MDESTEGRYDMILVRNLLTVPGLDMHFSEHVVIGGLGPHEYFSSPMVDINQYKIKYLTDTIVKTERYLIN